MPRFVFGFYYPQRVTVDMGPTAVCARSQYLICTHTADARKGDPSAPENSPSSERG